MSDEEIQVEEIAEATPAPGEDTPAEPVAEAAEETTADDAEETEAPKPKKGFQKRIDKLTRQIREQERQIQALSRPQAEQPTDEAPKRESFEDYEEYIEARAEYAAKKTLAEANNQRQAETQQQAQQRALEAAEVARDDLVEKGENAYEDFEQVCMTDDLHITPVMAEGLMASSDGHEVWYHLGKNPAKADKIARLPPAKQLFELGVLAASLKVSKTPSNAPPPPKPVNSRGRTDNALSDKEDIKTWMAKRSKQVHAK